MVGVSEKLKYANVDSRKTKKPHLKAKPNAFSIQEYGIQAHCPADILVADVYTISTPKCNFLSHSTGFNFGQIMRNNFALFKVLLN
jgi:hypothetical protein